MIHGESDSRNVSSVAALLLLAWNGKWFMFWLIQLSPIQHLQGERPLTRQESAVLRSSFLMRWSSPSTSVVDLLRRDLPVRAWSSTDSRPAGLMATSRRELLFFSTMMVPLMKNRHLVLDPVRRWLVVNEQTAGLPPSSRRGQGLRNPGWCGVPHGRQCAGAAGRYAGHLCRLVVPSSAHSNDLWQRCPGVRPFSHLGVDPGPARQDDRNGSKSALTTTLHELPRLREIRLRP